MRISTLIHPRYILAEQEYIKWRFTYIGGRPFISQYLEKFDVHEETPDFEKRRNMSYCPAFAKEGIVEIKNGIYQRMNEISRKGGSASYQDAIDGDGGGVDLEGSNMNTFIGQQILPEMMVMGKVGAYVDMPQFNATSTLAHFQKAPRPYLYQYQAEDIVNWAFVTRENELFFTHLLLRERKFIFDNMTGLPEGEEEVYRFLQLQDDGVLVQFWRPNRDVDSRNGSDDLISEMKLDLPMIPFVLFDIGNSLLRDVADYQIGLLNLASSDLSYALRANFPFYTEQYDPRTEDLYKDRGPLTQLTLAADGLTQTGKEVDGRQKQSTTQNDAQEMKVGTTRGRRYPIGGERPGFINPSAEPLTASMAKQEQMRAEIRQLLNLAVSNVSVSRASAESKRVDQIGLESGLAAMGLELEGGERQISKIWEFYLNSQSKESAQINYPNTYSLKSDAQRMDEAKQQKELMTAVPSKTFQKRMAGKIIDTMFEGKSDIDELNVMQKEVKDANYITSDPKDIQIDMELGLVTKETASNARGYDGKIEVPKAEKEHADRLATIAMSQSQGAAAAAGISGARGVDTQDTTAKDEKTLAQKTPDLKGNPAKTNVRK